MADDSFSGTEIRTFLIADVRGYTRFTQEHGDEAGARLAARFAVVVREQVEARGGAVVELRGDEALCVFASPRGALRCAVELQRRCADELRADPSLPLRVGIGIDAGEAVPVEGGYRGGALNLAARLCSLAKAGQVLVSEGAVLMARKVDEVAYVSMGRVQLKGLREPVRYFAARFELDLPEAEAEQRRWTSNRLVALAVGLIAVVLAVVAVAATQLGGGHGPRQLDANVVGVLDSASGAIRGQVPLAGRPAGIAAGAGSVWVADGATNDVVRIAVGSGRVVDRIPVGVAPVGVAFGGGLVWVADSGDRTVSWIPPSADEAKQITVGGGPGPIAYGEGAAWVVNTTDGTLQRLDPHTLQASSPLPVGSDPTGVAAGGGSVWVTDAGSSSVVKVDPAALRVVARLAVGNDPSAVAFGGGAVWVANAADGTVTRLDPGSGQGTPIPVGSDPEGLVYLNGTVWVADGLGEQVARIQGQPAHVSTTPVTTEARAVAVAGGRTWVSVLASPGSHRGGTLRLEMDGAPDSLDPGYSFYGPAWQLLAVTNDGLVGYRRVAGPAGAQVVPDLAVSAPAVSGGGGTYAFQLRRGIRYSNGALVKASDFRFAAERQFETPGLAGAYVTYANLVGAGACTRSPKTCSLAKGIQTDDTLGTITYHLTQPDPAFLQKLALPFGDAVPAGAPPPGPTTRVPATGPYTIRAYDPNGPHAQILLVRNRYYHQWSAAAQPAGYPDVMRWAIHVDPSRELTDLEQGRADVMIEPAPRDRLGDLEGRYAALAHPYSPGVVRYLFLNTRIPPFSSLAARRAVNLAVDRSRLIDLWVGDSFAGTATCQILPPSLPGYRPYCPYTANPGPGGSWTGPDLLRALQLVRGSGTLGDPVTVSGGGPEFTNDASLRYIATLLQQLGYRVSVHRAPQGNPPGSGYFDLVNNSQNRPQIGALAWFQDYPAPSDFLDLLFTCNAFQPDSGANANTSEYCDPVFDKLVQQAEDSQLADPARADALWAKADHRLADQAAAVPIMNDIGHDVLSARIQNYQHNPQFGLLIDQLWIN
jgi:ABC-type transport system substrate-binding protein/class 3 adenylate cyclase